MHLFNDQSNEKSAFFMMLLAIATVFLTSCRDEPFEVGTEPSTVEKRANPFSVPIMKEAMEKVKKTALYSTVGEPQLNPRVTHLYVRFMPASLEELDLINQDTTIELFEEPLDVSFLGDSAIFSYDEPSPQDSIGYFYTTVEESYAFPTHNYEVISELYLPFDDPELAAQFSGSTGAIAAPGGAGGYPTSELPCGAIRLAQAWENEALRLTRFNKYIREDDYCFEGSGNSGGSSSGPSYPASQYGRIRIFDNTFGVNRLLPLEGVRVTTTRFMSWKRSHTDRNGYYKVDSRHRRKKARYKIKWEDNDFKIIAHSGGQAELKGPKQKGPWNFDIAHGTKANYYGTVFSAAKQYYDGERYGLLKPQNGNLFRMRIKVRVNDCQSRYSPVQVPNIINSIKVCIEPGEELSDDIYGTTIHELAHSAHYKKNPDAVLWNALTGRRLTESWAEGVEYFFTTQKYRRLTDNDDFEYNNGNQDKRVDESRDKNDPIYTSLVIDLMDDSNQRDNYNGDTRYPDDDVHGYTINEIERAVMGAGNFTKLKHNLLNWYDNPTEHHLHKLFNSWDQ